MDINEQIKDIKLSFRQMMDGVVAKSMRDKGLGYHLSWGATLPRLREMAQVISRKASAQQTASEHSPRYSLAIALWKENVRECKILATMLMPPTEMLPELAELWMEQTENMEIAEQAAMNLYCRLPFAGEKAYQWMADGRPLYQLCGFHVLSRLFMEGREPDGRGVNEFIDQAITAIQGDNLSVRKAAMNSIIRFSELGLVYQRMAKSATKQANLDFL